MLSRRNIRTPQLTVEPLEDRVLMAVDAFLKYDGLPGETPSEGHDKWIEVLSYHWGVTQSGTQATGGDGTRVGDIVITKAIDKATPVLFQKCCNGKHIPEVELTLRKAGGDQEEYMKFKMENVYITSVRPGGGSSDIPLEEVSFSFAKASHNYSPEMTK